MNQDAFNVILERRKYEITDTLTHKAAEYATEDRLHNFKAAALLQGNTPEQALVGMLSKHLVSVIDMVNSNFAYPIKTWDEKIGDSINYLILLEALLQDTGRSIQ